MPPKKKGKKKAKDEPPPEPEPQIKISEESVFEKELDLVDDLNDDFFNSANKTIQMLMEANRLYEAQKIKKYVDIIYKMHRKYVDELRENDELRPQISRAENKLRLALELTAESEEAMTELKEALGEAWRESDTSQFREQEIQEKLQEILIKCESLENKEAKQQDDSAEFGHLAKYKNIILRERDRLNGEVNDLEKRLQLQRYYAEGLEYINKNNEESLQKMTTRMKVLESEKQNYEVKIRNLWANLDDQKDVTSKTVSRLDASQRELSDVTLKLQKKISDFDQQRHLLEKSRNENTLNTRQLLKYEEEIAGLRKVQKDNEETIRSLRLEDKVKTNTINQLNKKYKKAQQEQSATSSKLYKQNRVNHNLGEDIVRLKNQMNALDKDLISAAQRFEELRRLKENIQRERDTLRSDIIKLNNNIADLRHTIMIQANSVDTLHLDINKLNVKLDEAKISISKAEKERDEMAQEMETLHERIEYYQEQIQLKSDQVVDLSEKLTQKNHALINVKKQLESVHSEKMVLKRTLETCTQERDNFRVLQTKTAHQIAQLTYEISQNQNKINSLNLMIERLNNDKKELQTDLRNKENLLASVRKDLKEMKSKNDSLLKTISDDELKFMKISQELDETRKEKNLIGLQMVRRNDEIVLLKDKMCIMQTALDQGQTQYNQRVEDIRLLKVEITNLQTERDCLSRALKSTADMREELIRLQRSLNQERIKVRSLTEDAKTPTGVHRWRILKGEDPKKFQLISKVQMLQRRNLKQELQKINMGTKLEEANKTIETLQRYIHQFPKSDCKKRLVETERKNRVQTKRLKARRAELAMDGIELKARQCIIDQFREDLREKIRELQELKRNKCVVTETLSVEYSYTNEQIYGDCPFSESSGDTEEDFNQLCADYDEYMKNQKSAREEKTIVGTDKDTAVDKGFGTDDYYM